ncbi:hypothetical protein ENHYD8BJ_430001 [Enhydrobacter sp. 8BJ]|nr:hypothetical protein ENHYD8BJ_430001 [Enhydrobacter sp. 8BJ]
MEAIPRVAQQLGGSRAPSVGATHDPQGGQR